MSVQQLLRREWGPFKGLYGDVSASVVPHGYASVATNVRLDNNVLETNPGNILFNTTFSSGGGNSVYCKELRFEDGGLLDRLGFGNSVDVLLVCSGNNWQYNTASTRVFIGYTEGTAAFTTGNTSVTGTSTSWLTNVQAGDFIKANAHADSAFTEIASVGSDTAITLVAGGYLGATAGTGTYVVRKTWASSDLFPPTAEFLNDIGVLSNGTNTVLTLSNNTAATLINLTSNTSIAKVTSLAVHKNRMFGANVPDTTNQSTVYWSPVNAANGTWTASQAVFPSDGGGAIEAIISYGGTLFVFKRFGKIYRMWGDFSTTAGTVDAITQIETPYSLGTILGKTVIKYDGLIWFLRYLILSSNV